MKLFLSFNLLYQKKKISYLSDINISIDFHGILIKIADRVQVYLEMDYDKWFVLIIKWRNLFTLDFFMIRHIRHSKKVLELFSTF